MPTVELATITELQVVLDQSGLSSDKTRVLSNRFCDYFAIAEQWKAESVGLTVTDEGQTELMKRARQGRLVLKDKRVQIEKTRKELKEESLTEGRAIDAVAKLLTSLIEPTEQFLLEQEEFAKRAAEERLRLRQIKINTRRELFQAVDADAEDHYFDTATDSGFNHQLDLHRTAFKQKVTRLEEEREAQRQADQRSREALLLENQRLQEEQRKRDEAAAQREAELQAQLREQQETEAKRKAAEAKRRQNEQNADLLRQAQEQAGKQSLETDSDQTKLRGLADRVGQLSLDLPQATTPEGKQIVKAVGELLGKVEKFVRDKSTELT